MVAYEMASELKKNNETVAMVFMVDTYAWFPNALTNCSEFITKCTELNLKSLEKRVVNIHFCIVYISPRRPTDVDSKAFFP